VPPLALYLHVPFCAVRCHYCDFNTYAGLDGMFGEYAAALVAEIRGAGAARRGPPASTVFLGGGTPTVLSPPLLASALDACRASFAVAPDAEITSEANPGTADAEVFAALRDMGVNRLSMGAQSFDDAELKWLGRIHDAAEAEAAFAAARRAGFANINLDFMFGLPGQQTSTWRNTLDRAIALGPEHISLYSLTVEHGTPLYDAVRRGRQPPPDDDVAADFYLLASDLLSKAGYEQYEISNWSRRPLAPGGILSGAQGSRRTRPRRKRTPTTVAATTSSTGATNPISASARARTAMQAAVAGGTCVPSRSTSSASAPASRPSGAARTSTTASRWASL
jgi:oxygen-independent coproporphyrinogen III oxidase